MPTAEEIDRRLVALAPAACEGRGPPARLAFIEAAQEMVDRKVYGSQYASAVAYLAAHLMVVADRGGEGPLASRSLGDYSESFQGGREGEGGLGDTGYGRLYLAIRRSVTFGPRTRARMA